MDESNTTTRLSCKVPEVGKGEIPFPSLLQNRTFPFSANARFEWKRGNRGRIQEEGEEGEVEFHLLNKFS